MLTSQNTSRAATASIDSDILGEVRWYNDSTDQSGEVPIYAPNCSIGSHVGCTVHLPATTVAELHATLVFGKRFILLKAPYPTQLAGRIIKESLIDRLTEITIGSFRIEIVPKNELGRKSRRPRVIRSQELSAHASSMSHVSDSGQSVPSNTPAIEQSLSAIEENLNDPQTKPADKIDRSLVEAIVSEQLVRSDERLVAIEATLGKLQTAVEIIQTQPTQPTEPSPNELSLQIAALGKSVAEELDQRLAAILESQAASNANILNQIKWETLRPVEASLEGLAARFDELSLLNQLTCERVDSLANSTQSQFSEWQAWREELLANADISNRISNSELNSTWYPELQSTENPEFGRTDSQSEPFEQNHYQALSYGNNQPYESTIDPAAQSHSNFRANWDHSQSQEISDWNTNPANEITDWNQDRGEPYEDSSVEAILPRDSGSYYRLPPTSVEAPRSSDLPSQDQTYQFSANNHGALSDDVESSQITYDQRGTHELEEPANSSLANYLPALQKESDREVDGQIDIPFGAYLREPLTELPAAGDEPISRDLTANLGPYSDSVSGYSHTEIPQPPIDESPYFTHHSHIDEQDEIETKGEPSSELSVRLKQMLAEIQAEEEQSAGMDADQSSEPHDIIATVDQQSDEDELAQTPTWLRNYEASQVRASSIDDDRTIEIENENAIIDQLQLDAIALNIDRTSILETPPEMPRFDWNKGSLLDQTSDTVKDVNSLGPQIDRFEPVDEEDAQPSSMSSHVGELDSEEREESIEEYMQKLLQRVKQGPDGTETALEELTVKSAPRSRGEFLNRASKQFENETLVQDAPSASKEIQSEFTRRSASPQASVDMDALRELANSNARRAIARSEKKRASTTILIKVSITSFAIAAAALILLLNGFNLKPPIAGFVAALVVAFLWGTDCYKHFKALKNEKPSQPVITEPESAEPLAVRTGDEADSGWRPSPI